MKTELVQTTNELNATRSVIFGLLNGFLLAKLRGPRTFIQFDWLAALCQHSTNSDWSSRGANHVQQVLAS